MKANGTGGHTQTLKRSITIKQPPKPKRRR
jgi:hypothetical protein